MAQWLSADELVTWKSFSLMHLQLMARLSKELSTEGLSMSDYLVLATLSDAPHGVRRLNEIGDELGWEKSRVSHHVNRMVERGLVAKESCPTDLRGTNLVLTKAGLKEAQRVAPQHVGDVRDLFINQLSASEMKTLREIAEKVLERLHSDG